MDVSIKDLDETKKQIKVTISFEEFKEYIERATNEIVQNFEKKGFRRGEVPREIVIKEIGEEAILSEAASSAVKESYPKIIKDNHLKPLGPPEIGILKLAPNNPLEFRIEFFVLPEIKLPDYKKIASQFRRKEISVKDEEVEQLFEQLKAMKDKIPKEQQEKINFDSPEEIKKVLRAQIKREKEAAEKEKVRDEILGEIAKDCHWSLPEILILAEEQRAIEDIKRSVPEVLKMTFEDYLKKLNKSEKELRESLRPKIVEKIKKILILREVQEKEGIEAKEEELKREIKAFMEHPLNQENKENIDQTALRNYLKEKIEQEKTLQFLEGLSLNS